MDDEMETRLKVDTEVRIAEIGKDDAYFCNRRELIMQTAMVKGPEGVAIRKDGWAWGRLVITSGMYAGDRKYFHAVKLHIMEDSMAKTDVMKGGISTAYSTMHSECPIKDGDKVRIVRAFKSYEMGCGVFFAGDSMRRLVGTEGTVKGKDISGYSVKSGNDWWRWPFFCLELLESKDAKAEMASTEKAGEHIAKWLDQTSHEMAELVGVWRGRTYKDRNDFMRQKAKLYIAIINAMPLTIDACPYCWEFSVTKDGPGCKKCTWATANGVCADEATLFRNLIEARDAYIKMLVKYGKEV